VKGAGVVRRLARTLRLGTLLPLATTVRLYGGTDKGSHGYVPHYVRHLHGRRWRRQRVLEIGVGGYESSVPGGSLCVWRDTLPTSTVVGMDLHAKQVHLGRRVRFSQGDQSDGADLTRAVQALGGPPDVVIDDGSHLAEHAEASFRHLFPLMPPGSLYVIEDVHSSYWPHMGGGIPAPATTAIGWTKTLIDDVQVLDGTFAKKAKWGPPPTAEVADVGAVHVYPGIVFIEKA